MPNSRETDLKVLQLTRGQASTKQKMLHWTTCFGIYHQVKQLVQLCQASYQKCKFKQAPEYLDHLQRTPKADTFSILHIPPEMLSKKQSFRSPKEK